MTEKRIGIVMHGVTGRMGTNQHLVRSILAIRRQGGVTLKDGTRLRHHERVNSGAGDRRLDLAGATAKFMGAAGLVLDEPAARRACEAILAIDERPARQTAGALGGR